MKKILFILLFIHVLLFASSNNPIKEDINHFINSGYNILIFPVRFDKTDWIKTAGYLTFTMSLFVFDKKIKTISLKNQNKLNDIIFSLDKYHGKNYTFYFSISLYGSGYVLKKRKLRKTGLYAIEAFLYSITITTILKSLFGRERPYNQKNNLSFHPIKLNDDHYFSLPSGHATISFAVSTVMAQSFFNNIIWKFFWYGAATMVSASRIYHNRHWISDVFLGGVIGYSVGNYVVNFDKKKRNIRILLGNKKLMLNYNFF